MYARSAEMVLRMQVAGAKVMAGGYRLHSLPDTVTCGVEARLITQDTEILDAMLGEGLIATSDVEIIRYVHEGGKRS